MYIRRIPGPVSVTLSDGTQMTRSDLPEPATKRWVASRKAAVVRAIDAGLISADEAMKTYQISEEELAAWRQAIAQHGVRALKATDIQRYRGRKINALNKIDEFRGKQ
ncbi:MAG: DUF1153 domain-containing protein [Roseicyclus sp.]|jgi:hypothetical protein